jgi:predicted nucleic acid-binding protein
MTGSLAIIDSNVALKVVLPDPLQAQCWAVLARLSASGCELVAPSLWAYETTSGLGKAVYLRQLTPERSREALATVLALGVRLVPPDQAQHEKALDWTLRLRRGAAYDSYYLALAESLRCDLWTADRRLANLVSLPWVRLVGADGQ